MNNTPRIAASIIRLILGSDSAPVSLTQASLLLLRVVLGTMMIHNGFDKLSDISGFAEAYVEVIGLPFPIFFAYWPLPKAIRERQTVTDPLRPLWILLLAALALVTWHCLGRGAKIEAATAT